MIKIKSNEKEQLVAFYDNYILHENSVRDQSRALYGIYKIKINVKILSKLRLRKLHDRVIVGGEMFRRIIKRKRSRLHNSSSNIPAPKNKLDMS